MWIRSAFTNVAERTASSRSGHRTAARVDRMTDVADRTAFTTGGARGIGLGIARVLNTEANNTRHCRCRCPSASCCANTQRGRPIAWPLPSATKSSWLQMKSSRLRMKSEHFYASATQLPRSADLQSEKVPGHDRSAPILRPRHRHVWMMAQARRPVRTRPEVTAMCVVHLHNLHLRGVERWDQPRVQPEDHLLRIRSLDVRYATARSAAWWGAATR